MTLSDSARDDEVKAKYAIVRQHISWLRLYADTMTDADWKDMRLRIQQQVAGLSEEAHALNNLYTRALSSSPIGAAPPREATGLSENGGTLAYTAQVGAEIREALDRAKRALGADK